MKNQATILSIADATALINWYNAIGVNNWGTWGNYPELSVSCSYNSFDTCHCRVKFDTLMALPDGRTFGAIADSRNVPGPIHGGIISFATLEEYAMPERVSANAALKKEMQDNNLAALKTLPEHVLTALFEAKKASSNNRAKKLIKEIYDNNKAAIDAVFMSYQSFRNTLDLA